MYQLLLNLNLPLFVSAHQVFSDEHYTKLLEFSSHCTSILLLGGGILAFKFFKFKKKFNKRRIIKTHNKKNYKALDDTVWGPVLRILGILLALFLVFLLVRFIVQTFSVWFPVLLGISGVSLAIFIVWAILRIRRKKMDL